MSSLPKVPSDLKGRSHDYLVELVRQLERELRQRVSAQDDGVVYIGFSRPYTFVDEAGNQYVLGTDVLPPGLGSSDLDVNAGEIVTIQSDPVLRDSDRDVSAGELVTIQSDPVLRDSDLDVNAGQVVTSQADPVLRDSDLAANGGSVLEESTSGVTIQHAVAQTGAVISTTSPIPYDDTIPQVTEGGEALSLSFTPKRADSRLRIRAVLNMRGDTSGNVATACLFTSESSSALRVSANHIAGSALPFYGIPVNADLASPGTATITVSARFGSHSSGTMYLNGDSSGNRRYGGVYCSFLEVTEYMP